jgi:tRNA threonylcarbamoyladenosine biosynthesis protein TsaB
MKLTLAIDCSMRWINLGAADENALYGEENINAGRAQAELLPRTVENFLLRNGFGMKDIGRIAVTTGPGYYTGIRVGLAYATALAFALRVEVVPVSSLFAIAFPFLGANFYSAPVLRARKGSLYGAVYSLSNFETKIGPAFYAAFDFVELIRSLDCARDEVSIIGPDIAEFEEIENSGYRTILTAPAIGLCLAKASLGLPGADPESIRATYTRDPD